jgi:hypothetical protein
MSDPFTWIAIIGAVAGAVGTGMSYQAQQSAAKDNSQLALLNAQSQTQAARQAGELSAMQASINQALAAKDAEAANANAVALERQAAMGTNIAQDNIRKTREEFARMLAAQRVQAAKSGVADTTGSPLELMMQTASREQSEADKMRYEDEVNRRGLFASAQEQRNAGVMARIQGMSYAAQGMNSRAAANSQIAQSKLDLYAARAQSQAMRNQATGALVSQAGTTASGIYSTFRATPRSVNAPYAASFNANGNPRPYVMS